MWKKSINILLAILLINAVTFIQSSNLVFGAQNTGVGTGYSLHHPTNWVSYILHELDGASHHSSDKAHPIKIKRRYVNTRSINFSAFLAAPVFFLSHNPGKLVPREINPFINLALIPRPAYYNFLFRLSPF